MRTDRTLRFGMIGAGFWARFQLAAWGEVPGARCVAVADRDRARAEALARAFGVPAAYGSAEELLERERPEFVDVVTSPEGHQEVVERAAARRVAPICQKPLAPALEQARAMAQGCRRAGVPLLVHENWRWQEPIRAARAELDTGRLGRVFRARLSFCSNFPVFDRQPYLREQERFILSDVGVHLLDAARFLFGEVRSVYARTGRIHSGIRGEDVATVLLGMASGGTVLVELSYASRLERERFPETFLLVEAELGSLEIAPDFWVRVTDREGVRARRVPPPFYRWADPAYALVHASLVPCCRDLLAHLRGEKVAETTAEDNLKTLELVEAAYRSSALGQALEIPLKEDVA
ncbi:MAG: Gfo/Idh/MocA family protein [Planctomycetota bacterium]